MSNIHRRRRYLLIAWSSLLLSFLPGFHTFLQPALKPLASLIVIHPDERTDRHFHLTATGEHRFVFGSSGEWLTLAAGTQPLDLVVERRGETIILRTGQNLTLTAAQLHSRLIIEAAGSRRQALRLGSITAAQIELVGWPRVRVDGPVRAADGFVSDGQRFTMAATGAIETEAGSITIHTVDWLSLSGGRLQSHGALDLRSAGRLRLEDQSSQPLYLLAGRELTLVGADRLEIVALRHPASSLQAGGEMRLQSSAPIQGDAHYLTGGSFRLEQLNGRPAPLFSPNDPIILADGNVSLGNYTGASLHVLAGGSVNLGSITITGADSADNTINPSNNVIFNNQDPLSSLALIELSNKETLIINGSSQPTLDVRAGIEWDTFAGGAPGDKVIPEKSVAPTFQSVQDAAIIIDGAITINQPNGLVFLSNQYRPDSRRSGNILTGGISVKTTSPGQNGGRIIIDSQAGISTGLLDSSVTISGAGLTGGDGGPITLLAADGSISSGAISSFSLNNNVASGPAGNGGAVTLAATTGIVIGGGTGGLNSSTISLDGGAGNGGSVRLTTNSGAITLGPVSTNVLGDLDQPVGSGGQVTIRTNNGAVSVGNGSFFAAIHAGTSGDGGGSGGAVTVQATSGIQAAAAIFSSAGSTTGNGGQIRLSSSDGNISSGDLISSATSNGPTGRGGNVLLDAPGGAITTGEVQAHANAFFINFPADHSGDITMLAGDGDLSTELLSAYSEARGLAGDTGNGGQIDLQAINGQIIVNGDLRAFARSAINNNNSATAGHGGLIRLQATSGISLSGQVGAFSEATGPNGTANDAGSIVMTTTGSLLSSGDFLTYSSGRTNGGDGGPIQLTAGSGVTIRSGQGILRSAADAQNGNSGSGGAITVKTNQGDLTLAQVDSHTRSLDGSSGSGGDIHLETGLGSLNLIGLPTFFPAVDASVSATNSGTAGGGGAVTMLATQGITLLQQLQTNVFGPSGSGGAIRLITSSGPISASLISAQASSSGAVGAGGDVLLQAVNGSVSVSGIDTSAVSFFINNPAGAGGDIRIEAGNGSVQSGSLAAHSETRGANGNSGDGGAITVAAPNGDILISENVSGASRSLLNNGNTGATGHGGDLNFQAGGSISINGQVEAAAESIGPGGQAGPGGKISMSAGDDIQVSALNARSIGGSALSAGGQVAVTVGNFFRATGFIVGTTHTISTEGFDQTSVISITHGGGGLTPFIVGDAGLNGTAGRITSGAAVLNPTEAFLFNHFETPNIWLNSVPGPLAISKTAEPTTVTEMGEEIRYTIILGNDSTQPLAGAHITDTLPSAVRFDRWLQQNGASILGNEITWQGTVPANGSVVLSFAVEFLGGEATEVTNIVFYDHPSSRGSGQATVAVETTAAPILIERVYLPLMQTEDRILPF